MTSFKPVSTADCQLQDFSRGHSRIAIGINVSRLVLRERSEAVPERIQQDIIVDAPWRETVVAQLQALEIGAIAYRAEAVAGEELSLSSEIRSGASDELDVVSALAQVIGQAVRARQEAADACIAIGVLAEGKGDAAQGTDHAGDRPRAAFARVHVPEIHGLAAQLVQLWRKARESRLIEIGALEAFGVENHHVAVIPERGVGTYSKVR